MSLPNNSNKINELCQRLANLEKLVGKGIYVEADHPDTTETRIKVPLGGTIRFASNGSIKQDLQEGSALIQQDTDIIRFGQGRPDDPRQDELNKRISDALKK